MCSAVLGLATHVPGDRAATPRVPSSPRGSARSGTFRPAWDPPARNEPRDLRTIVFPLFLSHPLLYSFHSFSLSLGLCPALGQAGEGAPQCLDHPDCGDTPPTPPPPHSTRSPRDAPTHGRTPLWGRIKRSRPPRSVFSGVLPHHRIVSGTMGSSVSLVGTRLVRRRKQYFLSALEN
jgi:hypothetical protein